MQKTVSHRAGRLPASTLGPPHRAAFSLANGTRHRLGHPSPILNKNVPAGAAPHPRCSVVAAAAPAGTAVPKRSKRPTIAQLQAALEEVLAENEALRAALASHQGCAPDQVTIPLPGAATSSAMKGAPSEVQVQKAAAPPATAAAAAAPAASEYDLESGILWPAPGGEPNFWDRAARATPIPVASQDGAGSSNAGGTAPDKLLHVVHVTAEMAPIAKVGGLGDVITGLTKACLDRGHTVEIILPFYECLPLEEIQDLTLEHEFDCPKGRVYDGKLTMGSLKTLVYSGSIAGCPVLLVRPDWEATGTDLFRGGRIYGGSYNEAEAYLYFCRAALELLVVSGRRPDIIHAHEWQCSAVPMLFWEVLAPRRPDLRASRPVLTIHNMDNMGECKVDEFAATGADGSIFAEVNKALDERTIGHNPERICLLKGGIVYSSAVTTVSRTYAKETLHGGAAGWLKPTLARPEISAKYRGVLNGIDTNSWDPATDPLLPACYSATHPGGKALCKRFLQLGLGMDVDPAKPLVAVISRLVPQKGIHLIEAAVGRTVSLGGQFVLLGTGHADGGLRRMAEGEFRAHPDVRLAFAYSEPLAHLIYAAADFFLVPSMFEPCGLTQMIALRYGAVPVVRGTGGLADTVCDVSEGGSGSGEGGPGPNGFVFSGIDAGAVEATLDRALGLYKQRPAEWQALSVRNMAEGQRWSWVAPAEQYEALYNEAMVK